METWSSLGRALALGGSAAFLLGAALMMPAAGGCSSAKPAATSGTGGSDGGVTSTTGGPGAGGSGGTGAGAGSTTTAGSGGGAPDGGTGGGSTGDPTGVTAARASDFLGSIGVCVHMAQGVDDPAKSATALAFAGIRNLRDDGNPATVPAWISVYQQAGVRTDFLPNDIPTTIAMAKQLQAAGALLAVEGPNEPNNFPITYQGQTSSSTSTFTPVAHFQRDLYAAVHAEPSLAGVPVFHSSEAGGSEPNNVGLQYLTIPAGAGTIMPDGTRYADYANTHNYVCGHSNQLVDNVCWNATDPTLNGDWDGPYVEYGHTWYEGFAGYANGDLVTLPKVSTETGWVTTGNGAITQEQQGRVFLNLYLAAFKRGWAYTFVYMLRDDPVQGYWGLFDTSYQPKTSGTYLHNLTTILADAGAGAGTPGKLDYSIASEPATVHDLLLQKGDGTFELVVWDERPGGGSDDVVVSLGKARALVKLYDPTTGTAATKMLSGAASVTVTVSDHPVVIEI